MKTNFWKNLNLPNKLTLLRLLLAIPFIILCSISTILWFYRYSSYNAYELGVRITTSVAILIFIVAMITDYFDGKIARKENIVTSFGKLWDPIADKIMTTTALIFLAVWQMVPVWLILLFILRDLIVDGCRSLLNKHDVEIAANFYGKVKTMLLSIGIVITMIVFVAYSPSFYIFGGEGYWFSYVINLPIIVAAVFNVLAAIPYIKNALYLLKIND
ncbi:CDP-diacylglycerol--glycerol-3-phosphate 3-phosphatidyltransferase [Mycoplasma crocodyli]|uniref:CDP-diacylglycerol--glycerol-3-phosphate 3-phosphatidyltransferase n=1 Tax=Mycoplasma crocodyli (strain ATCC 51981 / MP145) TaxID=512564 RepID=D5E5C1_MYCCM|nr:CDP-diacylglycerol--glycerol-3-phosphate 3-phosphatidyltransferase [Mycoplasma crocodyli]ADE19591.1 CDP-diacylglycerol--glycerol-3-phosphate 3-phosphatidyltransferase [Mycoplasma crocodyli MP145]